VYLLDNKVFNTHTEVYPEISRQTETGIEELEVVTFWCWRFEFSGTCRCEYRRFERSCRLYLHFTMPNASYVATSLLTERSAQ